MILYHSCRTLFQSAIEGELSVRCIILQYTRQEHTEPCDLHVRRYSSCRVGRKLGGEMRVVLLPFNCLPSSYWHCLNSMLPDTFAYNV